VSEAPRCVALKTNGERCGVTWGLSAEGLCLAHDPLRREQAAAARAAGGTTSGASAATQRNGKFRVVAPSAVPGGRPPRSLHDVVRWASWCAFAAATGLLDGISVREINRSLITLKVGLEKRDLLRRIKTLQHQLKTYQREAKP
jgi:hypothetical protein